MSRSSRFSIFATAVTVISARTLLAAQESAAGRVRAWRAQHEPQILRELFDLVAIPNVAADKANIARNAQALTRMFEKRRFLPDTIATSGSPVVLAERRVPTVTRTFEVSGMFAASSASSAERNATIGDLSSEDDRPYTRQFGSIAPCTRSSVRRGADDSGPVTMIGENGGPYVHSRASTGCPS